MGWGAVVGAGGHDQQTADLADIAPTLRIQKVGRKRLVKSIGWRAADLADLIRCG